MSAISIVKVCADDNDVYLIWTKASDACTNFINYKIYGKKSESDLYKEIVSIGDINTLNYLHIGAAKESVDWYYYIEAKFDCGGEIIKKSFEVRIDKESPDIVIIDTVSVNNGIPILGWRESTSDDTKGYIIYKVENSMNIIIGSVDGKSNTSYVDNTNNPNNSSITYRVVAVDSCDNLSLFSQEHKTIKINLSNNFCEKLITVSWNKYIAWKESDVVYEILIKKEGTKEFIVYKKYDGNFSSGNLFDLENDTKYEIKVRAWNRKDSFTSSSNIETVTTNFIDTPNILYLKQVTVNQNKIDLNFEIDILGDIKRFDIYKGRYKDKLNFYESVNYNDNISYNYSDENVSINEHQYYYQIEMIDNCDNISLKSNISGNILLEMESKNGINIMTWNLYEGWDGGIYNQELLEDDGLKRVAILGDKDIQYSKEITDEKLSGYEKCYYILANEKNNQYNYAESSISNKVCITGDKVVYIPTAINLNSNIEENRIFKPKGLLIDSINSELMVYNRWGEEIFKEEGIMFGWDGKNKKTDEYVESGVYVYVMLITGKNGKVNKYSGSVTVLR